MENEEIVLEEEIAEIIEDNGASEQTVEGDYVAETEAEETLCVDCERDSCVECEGSQAEAEKVPSEIEVARAEADAMRLLAQRTQADFDNYRKRNVDMVQRARADGKADVILEILPVVDNFDRAIPLIVDESVKEGVEKIAKQFISVLEKFGVAEIEAEGKPFNPDFHNAVFAEEVEGVEPETVTGVLQKGYTMDGKVIRYAMVKVSK